MKKQEQRTMVKNITYSAIKQPKRSEHRASMQDNNLHSDDGKLTRRKHMEEIQLQGIGKRPAISTNALHIGDTIVWNFGYKSEVVGIHPTKSGKQINFDLKSLQNGEINVRRMGGERLVAVESVKRK